ncbi:carboxypeptidase regulatory-like domain-containing protein, partial [Salmonella enterica subsp. enterica serovar Istanbul]|nr:carboxypeptidase regulatory-like domain-containing protein [Salmonella enterica subsp. enterica serovar Istanbul]
LLNRPVPPASDLWNDPARLARYDIVALSCEGDEANENKGGDDPSAREAMHGYANAGGHVFATHFQYAWLKSSPDGDFRDVATWNPAVDASQDYEVETNFPKGQAFAEWLVA